MALTSVVKADTAAHSCVKYGFSIAAGVDAAGIATAAAAALISLVMSFVEYLVARSRRTWPAILAGSENRTWSWAA
jgi:hypothetical protein